MINPSPAAARSRFALILAALFMIAFLLPIPIMLGPLALPPFRLVALVALIPCAFLVVSGRAGAVYKADILMMAHAALAVLSLLINHGADKVEFAGMYVIETLGPYMLARCAVRSAADFRAVILLALAMICVILPFTLYEAKTGNHLLRTAFGQAVDSTGARLGLERAFGPFEHPILYGNFVASCLGIVVYGLGRLGSRTVPILTGIVVGSATFVSLSSGPLGTLVFQACLMIWDKLTSKIRNKWILLFSLFVVVYFVLDILSNRSPFIVIASYLTFSAETAYSRVLIYDMGTAEVLRHPIFGIGMHEWTRPAWKSSSFDAFWLLQTMRYGVPAGLCLIAAFFAMGFAAGRRHLLPEIARYRKGWLISIVGLALSGISVHYWGPVYCWYIFLLGSGAWMLDQPAGRATKAQSRSNGMSTAGGNGCDAGDLLPISGPTDLVGTTSSSGSPRFCPPEKARWVRGND